jgi:phosphomannomutase
LTNKLFGTDGMRGEAGRFPLNAATLETVGVSLATRLKEKLGRAPRGEQVRSRKQPVLLRRQALLSSPAHYQPMRVW